MTTKFPVSDELKEAVRVLWAGGVILYPTDTVWGIGCDATNHKSVERVFEIKCRGYARCGLGFGQICHRTVDRDISKR